MNDERDGNSDTPDESTIGPDADTSGTSEESNSESSGGSAETRKPEEESVSPASPVGRDNAETNEASEDKPADDRRADGDTEGNRTGDEAGAVNAVGAADAVGAGAKADQTSDVVEARIVRPKKRKFPVAAVGGVIALLAVMGGVYAFDASVRSEERETFELAKERESLEGWQEYIAWADAQGTWTQNRTPVERHVRYAVERAAIRRAYIARDMHDRSALCAMLEELSEATPAHGIARRTLSEWVDRTAAGYASQAESLRLPPLMRAVMGAAFVAQRDGDVCHARGTVRVSIAPPTTMSTEDAAALSSAIESLDNDRLKALATGVVAAFVERHESTLPFDVVTRDEPTSDLSVVEIAFRLVLVPTGELRLPGSRTLSGISLRVEVEASGPATRSNDVAPITFNLSEDFALSAYQAAEGGGDAAAVYGLMLEALLPAATNRLAQAIGTVRYDPSGGVRGYSTCQGLRTVEPGTLIRGNTRADGADVFSSSCEEQDEYYDDGSYDEYADNSIGRPDIGYKFLVPTRSEVSILLDAEDFSPLVFVQSTCGSGGSEAACGDLGYARFTADPGVYTVFASSAYADEAGRFSMAVAVRDSALVAASCARDGLALQSGVTVRGRIGQGPDLFDSECGGTGAAENKYQLQIEAPSRVRCTLESTDELVIYTRTDCADPDTTLCLASQGDLEFAASAGTLSVFVDGYISGRRGEYGLTCTVFPESELGGVADSCEEPGRLEWNEGRATLAFDLANAAANDGLQCTGTTSPTADQVFRFELSERSHVRARVLDTRRATLALSDRCGSVDRVTCKSDTTGVFEPGTHYLMVDAATGHFPRGRLDVLATPMSAVCTDHELLRSGTTRAQMPAASTPSYFEPSCTTAVRPEKVYRLRILQPSRVRITFGRTASVSIQRGCAAEVQEVTCSSSTYAPQTINQEMLAGDYYVVVDGNAGATIELETTIERIDTTAN